MTWPGGFLNAKDVVSVDKRIDEHVEISQPAVTPIVAAEATDCTRRSREQRNVSTHGHMRCYDKPRHLLETIPVDSKSLQEFCSLSALVGCDFRPLTLIDSHFGFPT